MAKTNGRNRNGTFAVGNPGGPGRPRRAVERDYLAAFGDALSLDDWRAIVGKAVADAKEGDAKAREWLSRYTLGEKPMTLMELVTREALGIETDLEIAAEADKIKNPGDGELLQNMLAPSVMQRALKVMAWVLEKEDAR